MPRSSKRSKDAKKLQESRRQERRRLEKEAKRMSVKIPGHIKVTSFDSPRWKELVELYGNPYQNARGIQNQLWAEMPSPMEDWFQNEAGDKVVSTAQSIRDKIFHGVISKPSTDPRIIDLERKFFNKFGDFKKLTWGEWNSSLFEMYKMPKWAPDQYLLEICIDELIATITENGKIKPLSSVEEAFEACPKHGNSGMPFNTSKWAKDPEMVQYYKDQASDMLMGVRPIHPALLYTRRQPKGLGESEVKMRAVECPPKGDAIAGSLFLPPLYERLKEIDAFTGYKGASNIGDYMYDKLSSHEYAFEGDFSQFDSKVWTWWMEIIFEIVFPEIFEGKFTKYFDMCSQWYSDMPLLTPSGLLEGKHGLFSGCIFTNIIGSFVNFISTRYAMYSLGFELEDYSHLSYGDDIAIFSHKEVDMYWFERYMAEVSMDCNKSKQAQSSGEHRMISFLGFYHLYGYKPEDDKYIGVFPVMRSLPSLLFRERFHSYDKDTAMAINAFSRFQFDSIRYIGKIENWRNHPLRNEAFNTLVKSGMKLEPISSLCLDKEYHGARSNYDVNIGSMWLTRAGLIPVSDSVQHIEEQLSNIVEFEPEEVVIYCENS